MAGPGFIHLHVHSAYSLLEGALPVARLLELAVADRQPALGVADSSNLFGALEFSVKAAAAGIQPIISCEVKLAFNDVDDDRISSVAPPKNSVVLVVRNEQGFRNLSALISRAYLENEEGGAVVPLDWLGPDQVAGLICLSGGHEGAIDPLFAAGLHVHARERLSRLHSIFGKFLFVELQRHGMEGEQVIEDGLTGFAYENGVPLVATNEPFFPTQEDFEAHDALLAIAQGSVVAQPRRRKLTPQHYFKTRQEMIELFSDLPEALENTVVVARLCHFRPLTMAKPILPSFSAHPGATEEEALAQEAEQLVSDARAGLERRLAKTGLADGCTRQDYDERLDFELDVIRKMKDPGYFLIVADFIRWAKAQGIPVGPGRGSGAGSLVAYCLTITDLDPLRYQLLFERFLNPDRISMPDFDVDFCQERREEVIHYVQQKYGRDQVAQIITFGTLQARAALRDVGRVLQMPYPQVDRICKLVPSNPANPPTIADALKSEPELRRMQEEDETAAQLLKTAQNLEGLYRHASTHAAGIVIGDRPLQELVPLYRDPRSDMPVTQYGQKWVEPAGLVKFDFLGLKTLTIIDHALKLVNREQQQLALSDIPIDDEKTFRMLQEGDTVGVFQVESAGMRRSLVQMQPDRFEDLIALVALYRPGPMDNIPVYCKRKLGEEKVEYLHPKLEPILASTFGIITYQEQVQQVGKDLAGYTLAEADILRRAMGKKIQSEMDAQRERFVSGAMERDIPENLAHKIFDACAKFAEYGFNKSHSAPYAFITYQTAYLKANYPREFLAASMSQDMTNTDKLAEFKQDADRLGIEVVPPCVNRSQVVFDVRDEKIFYALCAVKGVGRAVAEHIVEVRGDTPFTDLADFANRIEPGFISKRTLETLVNAGALDQLVDYREQAAAALDTILGTAQRAASNRAAGTVDMFEVERPQPIALDPATARWSTMGRLDREKAAIGFHLSGHPLDDYREVLKKRSVLTWREIGEMAEQKKTSCKIAAIIAGRQNKVTKRGAPMVVLSLSDPTGAFECVMFSEQMDMYDDILQPGAAVIAGVQVAFEDKAPRLRLLSARLLDKVSETEMQHLTIYVGSRDCLQPVSRLLQRGGQGRVTLVVTSDNAERESHIRLQGTFKLDASLASGIKSVAGVNDVRLG